VKKIFVLSGILAARLVNPAAAQNAPPISAESKALLEAYISSDGYRTFAEDVFNRIEPLPQRANCPHMTISGNTNLYTPLTNVSVIGESPNRLVANGAWISAVDFDRCGKKVRRRALMKADDKGTILPVRLLPGNFRGNLNLERDAMRIAGAALMASAGCADGKLFFVTDVTSTEIKPNGEWTELWTASACGKEVTTDVSYGVVPDGIVVSANAHKP